MDQSKNEETQTPEQTETSEEQFDARTEIESIKTQFEQKIAERDEKINSLEGRLSRESKKAQKSQKSDESKESKTEQPELLERLDKLAAQQAGIKQDYEVELLNKWKDSTGRMVDEIITNDIFLKELELLRETKATDLATTNVRGGSGQSTANETPEYWIKQGRPPTPEDVPDTKKRRQIVRALMERDSGGGLKFYNEK